MFHQNGKHATSVPSGPLKARSGDMFLLLPETHLYIKALHTTLPYTVFSNRNNSGHVHGTVWWQSGLSDVMLPRMGSPTPALRGDFTRDAMISHAALGSVVGLWGSSAVWCVCVSLPSTTLSK